MQRSSSQLTLLLAILFTIGFSSHFVSYSEAAISIEQRKELAAIRKEVAATTSLIREEKYEEADKIIKSAQERVDEIIRKAGVTPRDRAVASVLKLISIKQKVVSRKLNGGKPGEQKNEGISFAKHVAPVLQQNCVRCHSNNPKGNLNLNSFAGMKKGGKSGPLLVPGNPNNSLIMFRVATPNKQLRMPKNGALQRHQIQILATWIQQGAKFDGDNETVDLKQVIADANNPNKKKKKPKPKVTVAMATGREKVSFAKDIAPWMSNLCFRCHSGNNPRSGFSVENIEKILQGGDTGVVLVPGDLEKSRLWDLVGKQDPIKMPAGQARITRTNWNNLKTWIEEGAKYDGGDSTKSIRDLVPGSLEMKAKELEKLSPAEFAEMRMKNTKEQWEKVLPKDKAELVETPNFILYGNVTQERLTEVGRWATGYTETLKKQFQVKETPLWKGKLALFVMKDRYGYNEFNLVIEKREAPKPMLAHNKVDPLFEQAYIVLQDVGDEVNADQASLKLNLAGQLGEAFLKRSGAQMPDWLMQGFGLVLADKDSDFSGHFNALADHAKKVVRALGKPTEIYDQQLFSPQAVRSLGYAMTKFLMNSGSPSKFKQLLVRFEAGDKLNAAMKSAYGADQAAFAQAFTANLKK